METRAGFEGAGFWGLGVDFFGFSDPGPRIQVFIDQLAPGNRHPVHSSIEEPDKPNRPPIFSGFSSLANILQPGGEYRNFHRFWIPSKFA